MPLLVFSDGQRFQLDLPTKSAVIQSTGGLAVDLAVGRTVQKDPYISNELKSPGS
ncbi:hypothetical protein SNOG_09673 [Parastagonospora nodorum SN15]|uniref:Uncharacterized protein n=1 Tax=Phaeosphaeria nodorum (strain SN15 / ATCC MYA-4574 / FGSC 10173) TaxID=321614 RepID=Q0UEZ1_PHANO|nr:hypothetical protein SNOG_09673 [Parastagonospora nodorum SN15]EAT82938.1 hypothetical protein SNOG_09673 [Parastagonospora nodorum SN15]